MFISDAVEGGSDDRNLKWICQEKNCPPENFYPRIKIFNDCIKNFCPTLKIFVRLARLCLEVFSSAFSVLLAPCKCFSYCLTCSIANLFYHTLRIVSDFYSDSVGDWGSIQSQQLLTEQPETIMHWHELTNYQLYVSDKVAIGIFIIYIEYTIGNGLDRGLDTDRHVSVAIANQSYRNFPVLDKNFQRNLKIFILGQKFSETFLKILSQDKTFQRNLKIFILGQKFS